MGGIKSRHYIMQMFRGGPSFPAKKYVFDGMPKTLAEYHIHYDVPYMLNPKHRLQASKARSNFAYTQHWYCMQVTLQVTDAFMCHSASMS